MLPLPLVLSFTLAAPAVPRSTFTAQGPKAGSSARQLPSGDQSVLLHMANPTPGDLSQDGFVSLTGAELSKVLGSLSGVEFERIAVSAGGRGPLPDLADSVSPAPGLSLLPIRRVDLDADGVFEAGDRIEFFAQGPSFWAPHSAWPDSLHELNIHPWDLERRYLVRLDAPSGSPNLPISAPSGNRREFASTIRPVWSGKHLLLRSSDTLVSGREWYWMMSERSGLSPTALAHPATRDLPGLQGSTATAVVRLALDVPGTSDTLRAMGGTSRLLGISGHQSAWSITGMRPNGNEFRWSLTSRTRARFESFTLHYKHSPSVVEPIPFPAPTLGAFQIPVQGAGISDTVVAIEEGVGTRLIPLRDGVLRDSATTHDTWYVFLRAKEPTYRLVAWKFPFDKQIAPPEEFSRTFDRDLVVVAPDSFLDVASQYAKFRSDARRARPFSTTILRAEDLWLLHGNGSRDPLALRSAFALARNRWGTSHAMLLGGGHVDSRGTRGFGIPPLPVWSRDDEATDAILQYLDPGEHMETPEGQDIALGRVPARSRSETADWFEKLRTFEDPDQATSGLWRNTFLATADDLQVRDHGGQPDYGYLDGEGHTSSSEKILDAILAIRPWLNVRKVYLLQYPANTLLEKPEAQTALVDELGRGAVAFQYMGHGAGDLLADERLLDTRSALTRLRNTHTPFLFFAGSCTVGRHDSYDSRGLSEALVVAAKLGAFAAISGTRESYGDRNELLAMRFWMDLFARTPGGIPTTLGEALLHAGNHTTPEGGFNIRYRRNSDLYNLLGDPAMVPFPAGSPLSLDAAPKTLAALDTVRLTGNAHAKVRITLQTKPTLKVGAYVHHSSDYDDPDDTGSLKAGERTFTQEFKVPGRSLVSVSTDAASGSYSSLLRMPTRIPFGDTAALSIYAWDPTTLRDSGAIVQDIPLAGVADRGSDDRVGPSIRILPCDSSWSGGHAFGRRAEIPSPFCLNIALDDSSGLSTSDAPDEGILLSVPGTLDPWHPQDVIEGLDYSQVWTRLDIDANTFRPGRSYPLHVFARDLMGNASSTTVDLHIRAAGEIDLYEVYNRPNPVKGDATTFHFKLLADADSNGTVPQTLQASIRIHTLSGKLVRVLRTELAEVGQPRPRAVWNLQDAFRNEVANGLYPYVVRLRVKDADGGNWREIERRGIVAVSR